MPMEIYAAAWFALAAIISVVVGYVTRESRYYWLAIILSISAVYVMWRPKNFSRREKK